jgi:hypothetical protein
MSDSAEVTSENTATSALYDLYSPFQYQWSCINFFLAFWLLSVIFRQVLLRIKFLDINNNFDGLDEEKKRNAITYIMQLLVTTLALILQIYGSLDILFRNKDSTSQARFECMVLSIQAIAVLYAWELCYRVHIGWPLLVHHLVTILLTQLVTASHFDTHNILWIRSAILLGFYATTEHLSFVALFFYRLRLYPAWHGRLFYAAAVQAFVLKTIVSIYAVGYAIIKLYLSDDDATNWMWFWRFFFLPTLLVLYASQVYACKILYNLSSRCRKAPALPGESEISGHIESALAEEIHSKEYELETGGYSALPVESAFSEEIDSKEHEIETGSQSRTKGFLDRTEPSVATDDELYDDDDDDEIVIDFQGEGERLFGWWHPTEESSDPEC